ncbi:hypothetical protein ACIBQ1_49060 [Nonomuraea sp. NPDC050153]|uniref:hypothetical protein n=1 Tax=Nonomuraea sp. NPDC050153 TaxID=3364359 RepID=UPI0037AD00C5
MNSSPPSASSAGLALNQPGPDITTRAKDVEGGPAAIVTVGTLALANLDLVERVHSGAPLNTPDPASSTAAAKPTTPPTPPEKPLP